MRRAVLFVALSVGMVATSCTVGDDRRAAPPAITAHDAVIPAPPVPLDQHPLQFAEGNHYFVVHREKSLEWRSMAAFSFEARRWRKLPKPPILTQAAAAWDGSDLVVVGLSGCRRPEGIRCTRGRPEAAYINPGKGGWRFVDLGLGEIEVDSEIGWSTQMVGGRDEAIFLQDEDDRVQRLTEDGRLVSSASPPATIRALPCLTSAGLLAVSSDSADDVSVTPLSPQNVKLWRLPYEFREGASWEPLPPAMPTMTAPEAEARAVCGGGGVVLLDVVNERALLWRSASPASWQAVRTRGAGLRGHDSASRMQATDDGDLVGTERAATTQYVYRLQFNSTGGDAAWTRQAVEWVGTDVVADRVLTYPDQRPTPNDRKTWELTELAL